MFLVRLLILLLSIPISVDSISCYECIGGRNDPLCNRYTGASCGYGLFGCIKIATYSGGVDKVGNFIDDDRSVISMIRGCNILPLGGVDACQQSVFPGIRMLTCYCYSDYCNLSPPNNYSFTVLACSLLILWFFL